MPNAAIPAPPSWSAWQTLPAQIGATGEGLLCVLDDGRAAYWSGTSFATAVVSAEVVKTNPPVLPPPSVVPLEAHLATRLGTPPPTSANPVG